MRFGDEMIFRRYKTRLLRKIGSFNFAALILTLFVSFGLITLWLWTEEVSLADVQLASSTADAESDLCDVIHTMSVVGGHNATFGFSVMLKSLLSVRRSPLYLHLLVDEDSHLVVKDMLDSWMISGLQYKFYDIGKYRDLISWIPNQHYSGTYGLLKLLVPHILIGVQRVIVLDTDLLFMDDILPMWRAFEAMLSTGHLFGLVENQSDWYLKTAATASDDPLKPQKMPWPALDRGFNSGMILIDLAGLQKSGLDWMTMWKEVAERHLKTYQYVTLADQDIFNAVFAEHPDIVVKLACDWNLQLSYGSKEAHCLTNLTSIFRIVHFNHPEKTALLFEYGDGLDMDGLFASVYAKAVETNGYSFRSMFTSCANMEPLKPSSQSQSLDDLSPADACYEIRLETVTVRRIFPYFFSGRLGKRDTATNRLGLITQLSFERISQLELICRNWPQSAGAISAAVYVNDADLVPLIRLLLDDSSCLSSSQVHLHLVFRHGSTYPVNLLRNVALKYGSFESEYALIADADFIPSSQFDSLIDLEKIFEKSLGRIALVIPAFDVSSFVDLSLSRDGSKIDKTALVDLWDRGLAQPFQSIKWPAGHAPTNATRWRSAAATVPPYEVLWAPDYEPYVVIKTKQAPRFDERFVGFGWNKVSYTMQLDAVGYKFLVHPTAFVMHLPHLPSLDLMRFRSNSLYQTCLENLKLEFVNELASQHGASALKYLKAMPVSKS